MRSLCVLFLLCLSLGVAAGEDSYDMGDQGRVVSEIPTVLPWRDRTQAVNTFLEDRLTNLLPQLMRDTGIDMWLIINREYNEDPVYLSLVPEPVFAARRTTMLLLHDLGPEKGIERITVGRYAIGSFESVWDGGTLDSQWARLGEVLKERNPKKIGINVSRHWPVADGLSEALHQRLVEVLPKGFEDRVTSAEELAVRWLETRSQMELEIYPQIVGIARAVIAEGFSNDVITPGVTTTDDVAAFLRQRFSDLGLPIWFHPYVNLQRQGVDYDMDNPFYGTSGVIKRGDVLHTDVGITYMRLSTDTQEMGYVLRAGEKDIPQGLKDAMAVGNRWQDILCSNFVTGRTGNEILAATIAQNEKEGIISSTYTHPLGPYGHGPGPTIGMWDNQGKTPIRGDWPLYANTGYAIEGNVKVKVPEWNNQYVQIKLEQSAYFDGKQVIYAAGRQTKWHIVR